jgi:hypothetical protein
MLTYESVFAEKGKGAILSADSLRQRKTLLQAYCDHGNKSVLTQFMMKTNFLGEGYANKF